MNKCELNEYQIILPENRHLRVKGECLHLGKDLVEIRGSGKTVGIVYSNGVAIVKLENKEGVC